MDSETARAMIAAVFRSVDLIVNHLMDIERSIQNQELRDWTLDTPDSYLQRAQYLLESSYLNYKHPAGEDSSTLGVDEALALLTSKGYSITAPVFPS